MTEAQLIDGIAHWPIYYHDGDRWRRAPTGRFINLCPTNSQHTYAANCAELRQVCDYNVDRIEMLVRGPTLGDCAWGLTLRRGA